MREDEAAALRATVGEEKGWAASELFDIAQNGACSPSQYVSTMEKTGAASSAAIAGDTSGGAPAPATTSTRVTFVEDNPYALVDFRGQPSPTQIRVRVKISDEAFNNQRPSNFNDYIGFFRVADLRGRIDTNGDGVGDLSPGDKGYANAARTQALVGKFMLSDAAGQDQASGPIFFDDVELVSIFVRFNGAANLKGDLYFTFPEANSDGARHFQFFGGMDDLTFEDMTGGPEVEFDDFLITIVQVAA